MNEYRTIEVDFSDGVIDVTLNRPDRLNAINIDMAEELAEAADRFAHRENAKVLVLRGAGRAFNAGADVGSTADDANGETSVAARINGHARMQKALASIETLPVVKIAQVHGHCVGAGLVLASMCELRIAGSDAQFSVPELAFGIPFSMGGLPRLVRYVGLTKAADMVLTGRRVGAQEARDAGLITRVVDSSDLGRVVAETAEQLSAHPKYLVLETVERLREVGVALLEGSRSDLSSLVLATLDAESRQVMAEYARRILSKKRTKDKKQ